MVTSFLNAFTALFLCHLWPASRNTTPAYVTTAAESYKLGSVYATAYGQLLPKFLQAGSGSHCPRGILPCLSKPARRAGARTGACGNTL